MVIDDKGRERFSPAELRRDEERRRQTPEKQPGIGVLRRGEVGAFSLRWAFISIGGKPTLPNTHLQQRHSEGDGLLRKWRQKGVFAFLLSI